MTVCAVTSGHVRKPSQKSAQTEREGEKELRLRWGARAFFASRLERLRVRLDGSKDQLLEPERKQAGSARGHLLSSFHLPLLLFGLSMALGRLEAMCEGHLGKLPSADRTGAERSPTYLSDRRGTAALPREV